MSENKENINKEEQYSLSDDRRVKTLSPGALTAKRVGSTYSFSDNP